MPRISKNRREFAREQKRLYNILFKEQRQKGINIDEPLTNIPDMPLVVTKKRLEAIQKITRSEILKGATKRNPITGETEEYTVPKSRPRNPANIKPLMSQREMKKVRKQAAEKALKTREYHQSTEYRDRLVENYRLKDSDLQGWGKYYVDQWQQGYIKKSQLEQELDSLYNQQQERDNYTDIDRQLDEEYNAHVEPDELEDDFIEETIEDLPEELYTDTPDEPDNYDDFENPSPDDYGIPDDTSQPIEYIRHNAQFAENQNLANLITQILDDQIATEGYEAVAERIEESGEDIMALFDVVAFDSDGEDLFINVEALIEAITGDAYPYLHDIHSALQSDIEQQGYWTGRK